MKSIATLLCLGSLALASPIAVKRDLGSNTQNQLTDGTACRNLTIVFARGTFESGNVGSSAGPRIFKAMADQIGESSIAVQGVDYPADTKGFNAGGDAGGSQKMADLVAQAQSQCPSTKVVMSGYSQGGQLVHNAANMVNSTATDGVNSVVIFGDPDNGQAVGSIPASKVKVFCHQGDNICAGGSVIMPAHVDYSNDAKEAAQFVLSLAGLV